MSGRKGYKFKLSTTTKERMKKTRLEKDYQMLLDGILPRKGRKRKTPLTEEERLALIEVRKEKALQLKNEREKPVEKFYNKHKLSWSPRPEGKAIVLAWIQPEGEDEVVQSIIVDRNKVDNVTKQTLLDVYNKNKAKNSLFLRKKSPALQSFKGDKKAQ